MTARTCGHMPGADPKAPCKLCEGLARGGPLSKNALIILNQQQAKPTMRECPRCHGEAKDLVTREGVLMCQPCAVDLDDE